MTTQNDRESKITSELARVDTADFGLMLEVIRIVFGAAYTQGQFDRANGFNSCTSLEDVTKEWMSENSDLLQAPLAVDKLIDRFGAEIKKMNGAFPY